MNKKLIALCATILISCIQPITAANEPWISQPLQRKIDSLQPELQEKLYNDLKSYDDMKKISYTKPNYKIYWGWTSGDPTWENKLYVLNAKYQTQKEVENINLAQIDLTNVDLIKANLTQIDPTQVDLTKVDLSQLDLANVDLEQIVAAQKRTEKSYTWKCFTQLFSTNPPPYYKNEKEFNKGQRMRYGQCVERRTRFYIDMQKKEEAKKQPKEEKKEAEEEKEERDYTTPLQRDEAYKILQVSKYATLLQIKKAYKKSCLKYHPDKNPGDETVMAKFHKLKPAYDLLHEHLSKK